MGCLTAEALDVVTSLPAIAEALVACGIATPADRATLDRLAELPNLKQLLLGSIVPELFEHPLFERIDTLLSFRHHGHTVMENADYFGQLERSLPTERVEYGQQGANVVGVYDEIIERLAGR